MKLAMLGLAMVAVLGLGTGCASSSEESEEVVAGESNLETSRGTDLRDQIVGYYRDRSDIQCGRDLTLQSDGSFAYSERECTPGAQFEHWQGTWRLTGNTTLTLDPDGWSLAWSYGVSVAGGKVHLRRGSVVLTPNGT